MTYTFPVSAGLLEHKPRIGAAIWEFLWLLEKTTSDEPDGQGKFLGIVLSGKPVSAATVARDLHESIDTAKANLRKLVQAGYITRRLVVCGGYSYVVGNSKKWLWKRSNGHAAGNEGPNLFAGRVENPSTENLLDERGENHSTEGRKPVDRRVENHSTNKERRQLRQKAYIEPSPDGEINIDQCEVDPRHAAVRSEILGLHREKFRIACEWNGREGKALSQLLAENPNWSEQQICAMVVNRFSSEGIASSRPGKWIASLGDYSCGPLDRFGKLKNVQSSHGNGGSNGNASIGEIVAREQAILRGRSAAQ